MLLYHINILIQTLFFSDYQELYATLSEVQRLESGALIVEDIYKDHHSPLNSGSIEVQCIYLEELLGTHSNYRNKNISNLYLHFQQ